MFASGPLIPFQPLQRVRPLIASPTVRVCVSPLVSSVAVLQEGFAFLIDADCSD